MFPKPPGFTPSYYYDKVVFKVLTQINIKQWSIISIRSCCPVMPCHDDNFINNDNSSEYLNQYFLYLTPNHLMMIKYKISRCDLINGLLNFLIDWREEGDILRCRLIFQFTP